MAINLRDYSRTAAQRGWGAGWPSCSGVRDAGTAIVTGDRSGVRFSVHKRIARLVDLLVDESERRGYLLINGQCGGYNCRAIGGTRSPSNHSWALAVDLNWRRNPMRRPLTTDIPDWMVALWNRFGFAWGGHYSGTPDAMHFEFMGTPADADAMTALALRELTGAGPGPAPAPVTPAPAPTMPDPAIEEQAVSVPITVDSNNNFRAAAMCEQGETSSVFARAWVLLGATWGAAADVKITSLGADGRVLAQWRGNVGNNRRVVVDPPKGVVMVTWEGRQSPDALIVPEIIYLPK